MWCQDSACTDTPKRARSVQQENASAPFGGRRVGSWWLKMLLMMLLLSAGSAVSVGADRNGPEEMRKVEAGEDLDPLRMNTDMARFLSKQVRIQLDRQARVQQLLDAIFSDSGLGIAYGNQRTKTVIETFESRRGNCLSFTMLFVVMARHIGLAAYFQEVDEVVSWDRRGEVVLTQQHMFAEVEFDNGVVQVDLLPGAEKRYRKIRRISDRRAMAHFYNNLGVEALAVGEIDDAIAWIRKSLELDAKFGSAWSNLGVAQRRQGDVAAAERSYLQAIEVDPGEVALNNLSSLYLETGRQEEAAPLLARSRDYLQRNPYYHFRLATAARQQDDLSAAARHLRQALRRHNKEAEFHGALAEVLTGLGQPNKAMASFETAIRLADDEETAAGWRQQLQALQEEPPADSTLTGASGER